jgi:hypothetical protein
MSFSAPFFLDVTIQNRFRKFTPWPWRSRRFSVREPPLPKKHDMHVRSLEQNAILAGQLSLPSMPKGALPHIASKGLQQMFFIRSRVGRI